MYIDYNDTNIIDRDIESEIIVNQIIEKNTSIFLLCSKSARGKSSIVLKALKKINDKEIIPIYIKTEPINQSRVIEEGHYLKEIIETVTYFIDNNYKKRKYKKLKFNYYISHCKNKYHRKIIMEKTINDYINKGFIKEKRNIFFRYIGLIFLNFLFKLNDFNYLNIIKENTFENRILLSEYIKYILNKHRFVIAIDNIQNIDSTSLKFLLDWIAECTEKKPFFIIEYTLEDSSTYNLSELIEYFKETGKTIKINKIENIESEYALKIISDLSLEKKGVMFQKKIKDFYENYADGDLRLLLDYSIKNEFSSIKDDFNPTLENLHSLNAKQKIIISILIVNDAKIDKNIFNYIINSQSYIKKIEISKLMKDLMIHKKIIKQDNRYYYLAHSRIYDCWINNRQQFKKYELLISETIINYYESIIFDQNINLKYEDEHLLVLLKLYKEFDKMKIYDLVNKIKNNIIKIMTPENAWIFLSSLLSIIRIENIYKNNLIYKVMQICLDYQLYKEGIEYLINLEILIPLNDQLIIYKYLFMSQLNMDNVCIDKINELLSSKKINKKLKINLFLILIINYRHLNQIENCKNISDIFEKIEGIDQELEYGYFLRLNAIFRPRNEGIEYIKKSKLFFEEHNIESQVAKTNLSLSFYLSIQGRVDEAIFLINHTEQEINKNHIAQHIFEVNKSAANLLNDHFDYSIWNSLEKAELTARTPFDMLAIQNNKLIWCICNKNKKKAQMVVNRMLRLLNHINDNHIKAFVYYNLSLYFNMIKDYKNKELYFNKSYKLKEFCHTLNARLTNTKTKDNSEFLLTKPWHVCFLSFWRFDPFF